MKSFQLAHFLYLAAAFILATIYFIPHRKKFSFKTHQILRLSLFWVLLINETWWFLFRHFFLKVPIQNNLPLHLCDVAVFMTLFAVYFKKNILYEMTYYISFSSGLLAIIFPNISESGAVAYIAQLRYFVTHTSILVSGIYFTFGIGYFPTYKSLLRCFGLIHLFGLLVVLPNLWLGTNYFYVMHRPANPSFLPPLSFPIYQIAFSGVYVIVFHLMQIPLWGRNLFTKHH